MNVFNEKIQARQAELERIEAEKLIKQAEVEAESNRLSEVALRTEEREREALDARLKLEEDQENIAKEKERLTEKQQNLREQERLAEESERVSKLREEEIEARMARLAEQEESLLKHRERIAQDSTKDNEDEGQLKGSLEIEERFLRSELVKKLKDEEQLLRRKLSDELRQIRDERSIEMHQNLNDTIEQEREKFRCVYFQFDF